MRKAEFWGIAGLALATLSFAQGASAAVPRTVFVESIGRIDCDLCVGSRGALSSLASAQDSSRVFVVEYFLDAPLTAAVAASRVAYYGAPNPPSVVFDGTTLASPSQDFAATYGPLLDAALATPSLVTLSSDFFFEEETLQGKVTVEVIVANGETVSDPGSWVIRSLVTEDELRACCDPSGGDLFGGVARALVSERALTVSGGGSLQRFEADFVLDPDWDVQNLGGVVFIQRDGDGAILNASRGEVSAALQPLPTQPLDDSALVLFQNIPNPVSGVTKLTFILPNVGDATLQIINVQGRVVRTLTEGLRNSGYHELIWDGRDYNDQRVTAGTYIVRLDSPQGTRARKVHVVR